MRPALAPSTAASTRRMLLVHSLTLRPTSSSSLSFSLSVSCPAGQQGRLLRAWFSAVRHLQPFECPWVVGALQLSVLATGQPHQHALPGSMCLSVSCLAMHADAAALWLPRPEGRAEASPTVQTKWAGGSAIMQTIMCCTSDRVGVHELPQRASMADC